MLKEVVGFIVATVGKMGYGGIIFLMFLESSFFPFPSEVVIPPAGYLASQNQMNLFMVIGCGILGSVLGAIFNYYIALYLGRPFFYNYGKYLLISPNTMKKTDDFFEKHGHISTFVGRLIPGVRQYISLPAGIAKMNIWVFIIFTALGAGIWVVILALVGYFFGINQEMLHQKLRIVSLLLLGFVVIITFTYILLKKKKRS